MCSYDLAVEARCKCELKLLQLRGVQIMKVPTDLHVFLTKSTLLLDVSYADFTGTATTATMS